MCGGWSHLANLNFWNFQNIRYGAKCSNKKFSEAYFSGTVHKDSALRSNGQNLQKEMPKKYTYTGLGSKTEVGNLPNIDI